jgi:hypothetical protein
MIDREQKQTVENDLGPQRTGEQLETDTAAVRRQRGALSHGRRTQAFQDKVTRLIVDRRREAGGEVEQVDLVRDGQAGGTPVVAGALLVRASLKEQDPELLDALVQELGGAQPRLDDRLLVLSGNGVGADRLVELAREVRARRHEASVDHIVPLNVLCKGEGGPARTTLTSHPALPLRRDGSAPLVVIDTGVAEEKFAHPWQAPLQDGSNTDALDAFPLGGDGRLDAAAGHGGFATGVAQQVDPSGPITVRRAIDSDGIGSEVVVAEQLVAAVREGAEVVNLSLGTQSVDDQPLLALQVAFELLDEEGFRDVLIVAAAGNFGDRRPCWPAAFRRVVAVAALTASGGPAPWSSHGHWVDVSCVGEGIVSTYVRGRESDEFSPVSAVDDWTADSDPFAVWSGTSFAAPQVAAEVTRRLSSIRAAGGSATPREVLVELLRTGRRLPDYGIALRLLSGTSTGLKR